MNQNFVKVLRSDGYQPRKGYHWAINPKRRHALQLEIERTLRIIQQDITDHKNSSKCMLSLFIISCSDL